ncbi:MAG: adenine phosphoribosyltransferase [Pirellulaceae bacterium]
MTAASVDLREFIRDVPDFPKPGILFRDITPLLKSPVAMSHVIDRLAEPYLDQRIDVIAAAEARGFIFAAPLAIRLGAAFVPIRKPGKLPFDSHSLTYDLEYGSDTVQMHSDGIEEGQRVLLLDDLLATGGTMDACGQLVEQCGGDVVGCAFVINLQALGGVERLKRYALHWLLAYA